MTIRIGAVVTLVLLMFFTAGIDRSAVLSRRKNPVPPPEPFPA